MAGLFESTTFSKTLGPQQIAEIITDRGKTSPCIIDMRTADRYYDGHADIESKERVYYTKDRKKVTNPAVSNSKLKSYFLRELVQQKQDYGFAKTFLLRISNAEAEEVDDNDPYVKVWNEFCKKKLFSEAYTLAGSAVNHGIAWGYVWIDEDGEFNIKSMPSDLVYPVWGDRNHTKLTHLVYNFKQEHFDSSVPYEVEYSEYWTPEQKILYNVTGGYTVENPSSPDEAVPYSHMSDGVSWGRIPYIALKGTDDEKPLLFFVKEHIDSYDKLASRSVDGLLDDLDPLLVIKEMSSDIDTLMETRELMKMTRIASISPDGDVHYVQAQTQIDAHLAELAMLRRDIIKFGYGIDYEDARFGGNPNQLVIKSLYQNMDTYIDGLERHFQDFIDDIKYFFDKWCEMVGVVSFEKAEKYSVLVKLDRSMMMNQSSMIDDTVKLQGTGVSQRTLMEFNPAVQDVDLELERIKEEKESNGGNLFNLPSVNTNLNPMDNDTELSTPTAEKEQENE